MAADIAEDHIAKLQRTAYVAIQASDLAARDFIAAALAAGYSAEYAPVAAAAQLHRVTTELGELVKAIASQLGRAEAELATIDRIVADHAARVFGN